VTIQSNAPPANVPAAPVLVFVRVKDDAELLQAWRSGDRSAAEMLVERHYDSVLRFFRTKAGADAEDLVQRTFLRCVEPTSAFRGDSTFKAFLFGIARNVLFEHIRSIVRDKKADPDFGASSILDLNPRASTIAVERAEQRRLVLALQKIPVELQMTLELYYWEELSVDELARALDVPAGTVKSRLHRARGLLKEALDLMPNDTEPGSARVLVESWLSGVRAGRSEDLVSD
jgi:RNA polymerase sigma-70 factor (ECF subfamily)